MTLHSDLKSNVGCSRHLVLECFNDSELRRKPFFSSLPAIFSCCTEIQNRLIDFLRLSPVMDNLVSFELESDWVLSVPRDNELLFPRSPHLTAVHVTLRHYSDCVQLLRQIGSQLVSLTLHIIYIHDREGGVVWQLASVSSLSQVPREHPWHDHSSSSAVHFCASCR